MCAGRSAIRSKQEHPVGRTGGQKGWKDVMQPWSAVNYLQQPLYFTSHFPQNPQTDGNGIDQTSKLKGIKDQLTQICCWSRSNSSWTVEAFVLLSVTQGSLTPWWRRKDEQRFMILKVTGYKLWNLIIWIVNKWINTIE